MASDALLDFFKDDIDKIVDERIAQERQEANVRPEQERQEANVRLEQERQLLEHEKQKADEQVFDIIKNLMNAYHITLEEVMEVLRLPQAQRDRYSKHLPQNT